MTKTTISQLKAVGIYASLLVFAILLGCSKEKAPEPKPADDMMTSVGDSMMSPAPPPRLTPISSSEEGYMTPPDDTYENTEKKWAEIRSNEEKYLGETVRFERLKVMSVHDDVLAHTANLKYVSITGELGTYEFERGMGTKNYIRLHEDDWIDVSGKFEGINSSGEIVIQLKTIKNLGYKN